MSLCLFHRAFARMLQLLRNFITIFGLDALKQTKLKLHFFDAMRNKNTNYKKVILDIRYFANSTKMYFIINGGAVS